MKKIKTIKINPIFICIVVFIFLCLIIELVYVGTGHVKVKGIALHKFAESRDIVKKEIVANRGTIYASNGEILAKDVNSYTVIAYLDSSRTKDPNRPYHVVDKEKTAQALSPLINMSPEKILDLLNTKINSCDDYGNCKSYSPYQVELGPGGRGISELIKDKIDELSLPGIDFISSKKRYYPNGDFLSYTIGYAKTNESGKYNGEMGLELYYNDELTGKNGHVEYQSDLQGFQITSSPIVETKAVPGNDIYLTIDTNIQMFAEQAMNKIEEGKPEWATLAVMEAKTGKMLAVASTPSFDNNILNIKSYYDPFVSNTYEPGSTMKIFSFMAAMENGMYDGKDTYKSGRLKVDDAIIKDHNGIGWGTITYDEGFYGSSNVAATNLALKLGRAKLMDFYSNLGYGKKTGISLSNESNGILNFRYNTELAAASYGQGITVTAAQMMQALSVLGNKGTMVKPYIVSKIVNSDGEIVLENKRTEVRKICSEETIEKVIDLMRGVVDGRASMSTGTSYNVKGYDLVGKTGTAEIASSSGGYQKGSYVRSFAGVFPGKDPEIIVYVAVSKTSDASKIKTAVKSVVKDIGVYLNIYGTSTDENNDVIEIDNYLNKNSEETYDKLEKCGLNPIVIGDGEKIINQYPEVGTKLNINNKVFLLTNGTNYIMPDITNWSRSEVSVFTDFIKLKTEYSGNGYVKSYSIKKNENIDLTQTLSVELEFKYKEDNSKE